MNFIYFFAEIESEVKTKILIADFTKGTEVYEHIEKELADVPISILGKLNDWQSTLFLSV